MKEVFTQVDGKWQCDFEALKKKTNKMFAVLEVERIFNVHKEQIKLIDVSEGDSYANILILTTGICYELVFNKTSQESYVNSITSAAVERINQALNKQSKKSCCICGKDTDLYSQTPSDGEYIVKTYCGNCLPD